MSFGGGGFGGFGASNNTNNNNQSTTFGGFGQNNNTNTTGSAFGGGNTGGFGQSNTGGGLFGNNTNTASTGGFGSGSAFGSNTAGGFGAKPAFGASTTTGSTGLFGSTANNTTSTTPAFGGGFGATNNTTTASPFGGGTTTGGGIFGASNANKPAFGAATTTPASTGLFGGATTGGFGAGGFGATNNPGLGGGGGDPPGTAVTPFQAFNEKEPNGTANQSNSFQNIVFQDAYKKWSPEELRLVDYTQGRRHGNASGGGAFGVSSNFGGFGANNQTTTSTFGTTPSTNTATGSGIFGNNNNTNTATSAFGGTAFGANNTNNNTTGSSLFGANKPSLFGATNQTQTPGGGIFGNTGGNAFGATNNTSGGFGQTANNTTGSTGLFGANNQANKPAGTGFSFGNTNNNNTANSAFGGTTNNAFGNAANNTATGGGIFGGGNNNTQTGSGGIFGNNNNQQQQGNTGAFGGGFGQQNTNQATGTSLFGNNQQKPATGLFGATQTNNAPGGLFGNNNTQQPTTSAFGGGNTATGGGIFGSKPATGTGTSLFGNNNTTTNTNTGLFGGLGANNQTQQQTGGGIFGGANNQQQKPSLFGTSQPAGGGIFGGQANQNQGSSLFGSTNQQQTGGLGSSLLGNSQQANNAPQGLTANLSDVSAYGSPSLFSSVGGNEVPNPGPLATPLNGSAKPRRGSVIPMYRLAPASASRFNTPQKRGFGFSYSTYGTPNASPSSSVTSTPGTLGRSLLGSSTSTSLSRSMSTNNLRRAYNGDDSILAPGAFSSSSGPRWYGSTGSKKLVINRDIRSDLFSTPQKDRSSDNGTASRKLAKRVSFDTSNVEMEEASTPVRALPEPEHASPQADETPRQNKTTNGTNVSKAPEMEQVQGNELAIVHEESNAAPAASSPAPGADRAPGVYWMRPSREELQEMNRIQRTKVDGFEVGREGVGSVSFLTPVDVSGIELDDLCGGIIQLEPRSATVYPVSAKKPPRGKGLNVPAKISLEQSWPRGGRDKKNIDSTKQLKKHIERLKRIPDTTFIDYKEDTGVWTFRVEHFTTYGLDDSDDDSGDELPDAPPAVEPAHFSMSQQLALDASTGSSVGDDTFSFRQRKALPGAFDEEQAQDVMETDMAPRESFLGVSSVDSAPNNVRLTFEDEEEETAVQMGEEYDLSDNEDMARSSIEQHLATELDDVSLAEEEEMIRETPGGVLRARMRAVKESVGPVQLEVADGDDWMEMLRKTVSPVKRDRQLLRELNESPTRRTGTLIDLDKDDGDDNFASSIWKKSLARPDKKDNGPGKHLGMDKGRGFATSIDLMNSLFEKPKPMAQSMRASVSSKGFPKWPYERQDKNVTIDEGEQAYHDASRPTWGPNEVLTLTRSLEAIKAGHASREPNGLLNFQKSGIQTRKQDVRLARFSAESSKKYLRVQDGMTDIRVVDGVPMAALRASKMKDVFHNQDMNNPASIHEKQVWELASILFDDMPGTSSLDQDDVRRAALSKFWMELVEQASSRAIGLAGSSEEKAVACLAGHRVTEACKHLLEGKNFRLATLVALIGTDDAAKKEMKEQVDAWHQSKMLSEFSEAIRTIYELLGGNVCVCKGMKGVPVEDRLDSFVISKKFGLDWKQSFGLRLWYALSRNDDLPVAVRLFKQDIDQDKEELPQPWYAEQGIKPLWDDFSAGTRQDLLWGLLQLFADADLPLEAVLQPENSQLSPLDMRLCWQLGLALSSNGKASYGDDAARKANAATIAYASQLNSAGEWLEAVFVLLHLTDPLLRTKAIQEHLCRHASKIGSETSQEFGILTEKFQIPAQWIWEALALYMRSVKRDATGEVQCLLRAELFVEAHRVLVQQVAPSAIIERDYAGLSHLISQFEGRQDQIAEWQAGGEIYSQFLYLLEHRSRSEDPAPALLERLLAGLHSMNEGVGETEIVRYAAVSDMADETAKEIMKLGQKKKDNEFRSRILNLPLTQDRLLYYSVDLSLDRYREVMSH